MVLPDQPGPAKATSSLIGVALAIGAGALIALGLNTRPYPSGTSRTPPSPCCCIAARTPVAVEIKVKVKLWLLGFGLMNGGELCNFLAYAFAPPSVVAPLGMVTLVANVFLAPLIVREPFRRKDLVGVAIAVVGGATVVYASHSNDTKPTPKQFLKAVSRPLFIAYSATSLVAICVLAWLSQTKYGDRFVLIDLTLCALAGSFTVLSTKAISSFLNLMFLDAFKHWVTYPVLLVLVTTAVLQVNFVNKSLQRFESRVVIPIQYMTFALSTIIGSAILYRDFEGIGLPSLINFAFGCLVSGAGVYLLTRDAPSQTEGGSASREGVVDTGLGGASVKGGPIKKDPATLPPTNSTIILELPPSSPAADPISISVRTDSISHPSGAGAGAGVVAAAAKSPSSTKPNTTEPQHHLLLPPPPPLAPPFDGSVVSSANAIRPSPTATAGGGGGGGRPRTVSLTLGGGYLLAASPGAIVRFPAAAAAATEPADEDDDDEEEDDDDDR
ncbi:hypothetical protein JCM3774_000881, partial [Rhodotorula dairenensis]